MIPHTVPRCCARNHGTILGQSDLWNYDKDLTSVVQNTLPRKKTVDEVYEKFRIRDENIYNAFQEAVEKIRQAQREGKHTFVDIETTKMQNRTDNFITELKNLGYHVVYISEDCTTSLKLRVFI